MNRHCFYVFYEAKKSSKRLLIVLLVFFTVFSCVKASAFAAAEANIPSRTINLVYDDSGSMIINDKGEYVDTWCQAKYAVEVFAGMLGDNDTMNIYVMSDFENGTNGKPKLVLKGSDGATKNVSEVHNMVTTDGNTPFNAVRAAEAALESSKADEKWLVVLTDGEFEDGRMPQSEIDSFFAKKPSDISVMYLGMGAAAGAIKADPNNNIFYEKAKNNNEILQKLTDIGTQVFNRDRLKVGTANSISFDIPMKELIVFAQGEKVSINGISTEDGKTIKCTGSPVTVQYSEKATSSNHFDNSKIKVDKSLRGSIATFDTKFNEGKYTVDVSGAKTVEVYYQPDVDIVASLRQGDEEVTDLSDLEAGDYIIDFALVKGGTQDRIKESALLGDVSYEAVVTNNGTTHEKKYKSGDTITIEEGPLSIDAVAHYLGYHTVQTHLDYSIYKDKTINFENADNTVHVLSDEGFKEGDPSQITVLIDGKAPTDEQWNNIEIPNADLIKSNKLKFGEFIVEKSDTPGILNIHPTAPKGRLSGKTYEDVNLRLSYEGTVGNETWAGSDNVIIRISDERNWLAKHLDILITGAIILLIIIILIGYIPGIKHYLPRRLSKKPNIYSKKIGSYERPPKPTQGKLEKKTITRILPYVAEQGTIRYVPVGVVGAPRLKVKGSKGRRMEITNIRDFSKKKNIAFDGDRGNQIGEELGKKKRFIKSSGLTMTAEINGMKYECTLND